MGPQTLVNGDDQRPDLRHRNHYAKPWVVQKFGGTSVGKFADKIAEDLVRYENIRMLPTASAAPSIDVHLGQVSLIIVSP